MARLIMTCSFCETAHLRVRLRGRNMKIQKLEFLGMCFFKECHNQPQDGVSDYDVQLLARLPIYVSAYEDEICKFRN